MVVGLVQLQPSLLVSSSNNNNNNGKEKRTMKYPKSITYPLNWLIVNDYVYCGGRCYEV